MEPRLRDHSRCGARRIRVSRCERLDALADQRERQLVDLAERTGVGPREIGHLRARIRFDETGLRRCARMELPQAEHTLVLVTKGTQVGVAQRC